MLSQLLRALDAAVCGDLSWLYKAMVVFILSLYSHCLDASSGLCSRSPFVSHPPVAVSSPSVADCMHSLTCSSHQWQQHAARQARLLSATHARREYSYLSQISRVELWRFVHGRDGKQCCACRLTRTSLWPVQTCIVVLSRARIMTIPSITTDDDRRLLNTPVA